MATRGASQLTAVCAVASFLWLSRSVAARPLAETPRLSACLLLLVSGLATLGASFFAPWLPGANGRFDSDRSVPLRKGGRPGHASPRRPRRFFLPVLVAAVVLRLEVLRRVVADMQCAAPGVEGFLPLALAVYEAASSSRRSPLPTDEPLLDDNDDDDDDDDDDAPQTLFDDLADWLKGLARSRPLWLLGVLALALGARLASAQPPRSTYVCSAGDPAALVVALQWLGVGLDALVVVLAWRVLAWARTTKTRLRTLAAVLLSCALALGCLGLVAGAGGLDDENDDDGPRGSLAGWGSLDLFDLLLARGVVVAAFLVSSSLVLCEEAAPSALGAALVFLGALLRGLPTARLAGTWENVAPSTTLAALTLLCLGFSVVLCAGGGSSGLRAVLVVRRALRVAGLALLLAAAAVLCLVGRRHNAFAEHPLRRRIYDARIEGDRWLVAHAGVSTSLAVAVREYRARHGGREPPPGFDAWYEFARARRSPVLDHFAQIAGDLQPFWRPSSGGVSPRALRESVHQLAALPDVAVVRVRDGVASYDLPRDDDDDDDDDDEEGHRAAAAAAAALDDLVALMAAFSRHLPDLDIAVNLARRPRVLAPWSETRGAGLHDLSARADGLRVLPPPPTSSKPAPPRSVRRWAALACPPGSGARSDAHWDVGAFCSACARPHSDGPFLADWDRALDLCHQPDLLRLHGYFLTPHEPPPVPHLAPLFSAAKTSAHGDILLPLEMPVGNEDATARSDDDDDEADFFMKANKLFWRGKADVAAAAASSSHELRHGGHQERLVHLVRNASRSDQVVVPLLPPTSGGQKEDRLSYRAVPVSALNAALPLDIDIDIDSTAPSHSTSARGRRPSAPLGNRYVLLADTNDGPHPLLPAALRSTSLPLVASAFRAWYSERLVPWLHFAPVDLRLQGLHGTLAYFAGAGVAGQGEAHADDARWIAEQGRRWARRALRREDREVYLFRLLLEWARVVDDRRDELGFRLGS